MPVAMPATATAGSGDVVSIERILVLAYLAACVLIGIIASRKVLTSSDEYWVAGRRVGPWVNAMAIMAALASGESVAFQGVRLTRVAGGIKAVGADGSDLGSHQAFWFAWSQFHGDTALWPDQGR